MIKIFVDSGSSIREDEKEKYGVEILPLKINLDGVEYTDGVDLSFDVFYHALIEKKLFPKTSLPSLLEAEERIKSCIKDGCDVLILTISSGISGTYNALKMLFKDEARVKVIDTKTAVGGVKILVREASKHLDKTLDFVEELLLRLIPRIKVIAIPETLDYLQRGGRLSKTAWLFGSILQLKPLITLSSIDGRVGVLGKERGIKRAMQALVDYLEKLDCDTNYPIVPSYTYNSKNLDTLIEMTDGKYREYMTEYDNLDPAIACHWGPNAFGYIFVGKN
jgi:DegV family protein with EDD domain